MKDELLNGELFDTLYEAEVLAEKWRIQYNNFRPHSSRNYLPPAAVIRVLGVVMQNRIMSIHDYGIINGGRSPGFFFFLYVFAPKTLSCRCQNVSHICMKTVKTLSPLFLYTTGYVGLYKEKSVC
jgi:hypothetical protein